MSSWKNLLMDVLTLTDRVGTLNKKVESLVDHTNAMDKRLVRVETVIELGLTARKLNS